ncbi:Heavy metal-associated domain containing protein [Melia azedarach]|uniref:Heavy metal-associated domain containing protein n=1 Tax=Melia azedarach TaxID=155640 RepID=A0ACC1YPP4_MELAZ|nr:Heavy metal-associated domain containing protein [Melia azedarach]
MRSAKDSCKGADVLRKVQIEGHEDCSPSRWCEQGGNKGEEKDELVVTGDEVDSVKLTQKLRKELGFATISSVEEEKEKKKETSTSTPSPIQWYYNPPPPYEMMVYEPNPSPTVCSIM